MKKHWPLLIALSILAAIPVSSKGGAIFYAPISAIQSDASSKISDDNGYTTAIDAGNPKGEARIIKGIPLDPLVGDGEDTASADNCTVNALSGTLSNATGTKANIKADGTFAEVLAEMTFNAGAGDNSQQEIVLDPESLEAGTTYDLRIYICNSSGQNRQVNLAFVGDGQPAAETGWFNEDDARTSSGGFKDPNQVYYINYRFTWDGDSTPGVTITQKSGSAPFVLYALTNQVVPGGAGTGAGVAEAGEEPAGEEGAAEEAAGDEGAGEEMAGGEGAEEGLAEEDAGVGEEEGLTAGLVNQESDEIGVESEEFYGAESLNSNGRWVDVEQWGNCWQPTNVPVGWTPYTNGSWKECDDCGWIFDSEEPWAWATYHYGRWCKVRTGCGWAWVPGKVWGASWVSWRKGDGGSCGTCIGWAPLPPEATCEINVGISSWVDEYCGIGPDYYTFVNIRDFGCCPSYAGCGSCIIDRGTYINIFHETTNITNICYDKHVNIYSGGPDSEWCGTQIKKHGGKQIEKVHVNKYGDHKKFGGKHSFKEGKQLGFHSPKIKNNKNAKGPKIAEHVKGDKIDKGWDKVKDPNAKKQLKNKIAAENQGKNPKNSKANMPAGIAEKQKKHHQDLAAAAKGKGKGKGKGKLGGEGAGQLGQQLGAKGKGKGKGKLGGEGAAGLQAGGGQFDQQAAGKGKGKLKGKGQLGAGQAGAGTAGGGQTGLHPGGKGKLKGKGQLGAGQAGASQAAGGGQLTGKGKGKLKGKLGAGSGAAGLQDAGPSHKTTGVGGKGKRRPGESLKGAKGGQLGQTAGGGGQQLGKGKGKAKGSKQFGDQAGSLATQGGAGSGGSGKGKGKSKQLQGQQLQGQTTGGGTGGGGKGKGKGKSKQLQSQQGLAQPGGGSKGQKKQKQLQQQQLGGQAQGYGQPAGGGGKGQKKQKQKQQQQFGGQAQGYGQPAGGGGKGQKKQKQLQQQQFGGQAQGYGQPAGGGKGQKKQQFQGVQQQQQQGGKNKNKRGKPTPYPP